MTKEGIGLRRIKVLFGRASYVVEVVKNGLTFNSNAILNLPAHYPNSFNYWSFPSLTYSSANALPVQIESLYKTIYNSHAAIEHEDFLIPNAEEGAVNSLGSLFDSHGSDKAKHGYHRIYAPLLLRSLNGVSNPSLLEIGLGTNKRNAISTMGSAGVPGASLRAFRDWMPDLNIYGADLDVDILFNEHRIKTAYVDQLLPRSFVDMTQVLGFTQVDVVIDDGLHNPEANLNTLIWALQTVKAGGLIIIEDIPERSLPIWDCVRTLLAGSGYPSALVPTEVSSLFIVSVPKKLHGSS